MPLRYHGSLSLTRALAAGPADRVPVYIVHVISGQTGTDPCCAVAADVGTQLPQTPALPLPAT